MITEALPFDIELEEIEDEREEVESDEPEEEPGGSERHWPPEWQDNGCPPTATAPRFPSCLNCPLPECRFDNPMYYRRYFKRMADWEMLELSQWLGVRGTAHFKGVTMRTVFRAIRRVESPRPRAVLKEATRAS